MLTMALERFLDAQDATYASALSELRRGQKETHWIWFVLPQLRGLGSSSMAERFGLEGIEEARHYLRNPLLRTRLCEVVAVVRDQLCGRSNSVVTLMGSFTDARKLVSSLTLFEHVAREMDVRQPDERLSGLAEDASAILDSAAAQSFERCRFTLGRIAVERERLGA